MTVANVDTNCDSNSNCHWKLEYFFYRKWNFLEVFDQRRDDDGGGNFGSNFDFDFDAKLFQRLDWPPLGRVQLLQPRAAAAAAPLRPIFLGLLFVTGTRQRGPCHAVPCSAVPCSAVPCSARPQTFKGNEAKYERMKRRLTMEVNVRRVHDLRRLPR